jgi:RNA polymerase sigma-70 factor (ECF subfamily)
MGMTGETAKPAAKTQSKTAAAFSAMFARQHPRIVAFARRRTGNTQAAEDIAAEVFRIAWEQVENGIPEPAWLFVTAKNVLSNHQRANTRLAEACRRLRDERGLAGPEADGGEPADRLLEALEQLPEPTRELLLAHYWDGLSGAECAALLGCSTGSVWVRLHRARAALRQLLTEKEES